MNRQPVGRALGPVSAATDSNWGGEGCLITAPRIEGPEAWQGTLPRKHWQPARHVPAPVPATGRGG